MQTNTKNNQVKTKFSNFVKEFLKVLLIISICINLIPVNFVEAQSVPTLDWSHIEGVKQLRITVNNLLVRDDLTIKIDIKIKDKKSVFEEDFSGTYMKSKNPAFFMDNTFENIIDINVDSELELKLQITYGNNTGQLLKATIPPYLGSPKKESPAVLPPYYGKATFEELSGNRLQVTWDKIDSSEPYEYLIKLTGPAYFQFKPSSVNSVIFDKIKGSTNYNVEIYAWDIYLQKDSNWNIKGSYTTEPSTTPLSPSPPPETPCTIAGNKDFSAKDLSFNLKAISSGNDLELTKDILKCLGENGQNPFNELKTIQGKRKLTVDGIIGVQTAFDLGYKVGETLNLGNQEVQKCSEQIVNYNALKKGTLVFYPATKISNNLSQNDGNKKLFTNIVNCLEISKETNINKIIPALKSSANYKHLIPNNTEIGAAFMYRLGTLFGIEGGKAVIKVNDSQPKEADRPSVVTIPQSEDTTSSQNCEYAFKNDFDNKYPIIDLENKKLPTDKKEEELLQRISQECLKLNETKLIDQYKSYQRSAGITADGKLGPISGFNLGFDVGNIIRATSPTPQGVTATTLCESTTVDFVNLPDADIIKIANCTKLSAETTLPKILEEQKNSNIKDKIYSNEKKEPQKSLSLLYYLGKKYGEAGGKKPTSQINSNSEVVNECTEAFNGNFRNLDILIDTTNTANYGPGEANLMQEIYVNCLKISGADFVEMTANFQKDKKLTADSKIGPVTGFNLGVEVGKKVPGTAKAKCQELKIDYAKLSDDDLIKIINCLGLSTATSLPKIFQEFKLDTTLNDLLYKDGKGVALTYYLGKLFGQALGVNTTTENLEDTGPLLTPEEEQRLINDPCARYNQYEKEGNLIPKMTFGGKEILLIPDSPGTLDWKKLTLDNFLGGGRNDADTINRTGDKNCLVGPGIFMGLIWKIVTLFESLLGIICVAMLILGGYYYLTAAGDDGQQEKGTKTITWALLGAVLVICSRLLVQIFIPRTSSDRVFYDQDKLLTKEAVTPGIEGIIGITNFILGFVGAIAVLMIIYGGYLYAISHGDEGLEGKGKSILFEAIIGIILVVIAYTIVSTTFGAGGLPIK